MSMRAHNNRLTICEVLRQINDRLQGGVFSDIRDMLALAEQMAKKMSKKLQEYNENEDPNWWVEHNTVRENLIRELNEYLIGDPARGWELLKK